MVFVDTSAWHAFFVQSDANHLRVRNWIGQNDPNLLTTDFCIDETLTLLAARRERQRALEAADLFFRTNLCQIHFVTPEEIRRAWLVFQQRSAAGWSFTDCTSKVVIDSLGIQTALAIDAHFLQFGSLVVEP